MGCDQNELDDLDLSELKDISFEDSTPYLSTKKSKLENNGCEAPACSDDLKTN